MDFENLYSDKNVLKTLEKPPENGLFSNMLKRNSKRPNKNHKTEGSIEKT